MDEVDDRDIFQIQCGCSSCIEPSLVSNRCQEDDTIVAPRAELVFRHSSTADARRKDGDFVLNNSLVMLITRRHSCSYTGDETSDCDREERGGAIIVLLCDRERWREVIMTIDMSKYQ